MKRDRVWRGLRCVCTTPQGVTGNQVQGPGRAHLPASAGGPAAEPSDSARPAPAQEQAGSRPWGAQPARCRGSGARLLVRQPPNSGARFPGTMPRLVFHHRPAEASLLLSPEPGPDVPRPDSLVPGTSPQPVSSRQILKPHRNPGGLPSQFSPRVYKPRTDQVHCEPRVQIPPPWKAPSLHGQRAHRVLGLPGAQRRDRRSECRAAQARTASRRQPCPTLKGTRRLTACRQLRPGRLAEQSRYWQQGFWVGGQDSRAGGEGAVCFLPGPPSSPNAFPTGPEGSLCSPFLQTPNKAEEERALRHRAL